MTAALDAASTPLTIDRDGWIPAVRHCPSPNADERPAGTAIELIVVHAISLPPGKFGGPQVEQLFGNTLDFDAHPYFAQLRGLRVSAHFFVRRDGQVAQFVSCLRRAWHAGVSAWQGRERCNDFSVGIELEGVDDIPYEASQYAACAGLLAALRRVYPIRAVVGHSDIAPGRKTDPGPLFDWARLDVGSHGPRPTTALQVASRVNEKEVTMNIPDWRALRREFPTLQHWTYLDSARKTIPPRCQEQAMQEYMRDVYENAGADAWSALNVQATRSELADLLGADAEELAFTKNTTEGLVIAAHAFGLQPGDNVVLTDMEHVANIWVWKHWEKKGIEIRYAQHRDGRLPLEAFLEKIDERTRVVSTAYITYGNGARVDLPRLGTVCRERGIRLVVDGVQAAGVLAAPLRDLNADVIAMGGHKGLFGLTGSGIVYCRRDLVDTVLTPFVKEAVPLAAKAHVNSQFDYVRVAHRFEGGNPNFLGIRVLRHGARLLRSIGLPAIESRVRELSTYCLELLRKEGLRTMTPCAWEERAQIVNVLVPDAEQVMNVLREKHRVIVNVKDGAVRISMGFFNDEEDLEKGVNAIAREIRN